MVPEGNRVDYLIGDGIQVIAETTSHSTGLIFSDMFNAQGPEHFQESTDFLLEAYRVLTADGWLVINCHDLPPVTSVFMLQALRLFKEVFWVALNSGNYVLLMGKADLTIPFDELAFSTLSLEQRIGEKLYKHARRMVKVEGSVTNTIRLLRPLNSDETIEFRV